MTDKEGSKQFEIMEANDKNTSECFEEFMKSAPKCHFRPMFLACGDEPHSPSWWECSVCEHTKDL